MLAQVEDLFAHVGIGHIIAPVATPADGVRRPAKPIFLTMLADHGEPALIDELIKAGGGGCRCLRGGVETALDLRLTQQIAEVHARATACHGDRVGHAITGRSCGVGYVSEQRHDDSL